MPHPNDNLPERNANPPEVAEPDVTDADVQARIEELVDDANNSWSLNRNLALRGFNDDGVTEQLFEGLAVYMKDGDISFLAAARQDAYANIRKSLEQSREYEENWNRHQARWGRM